MDAKKTNLSPELKEIYDRVMNTSGGPTPIGSTQPQPQNQAPKIPPASSSAPPSIGMPSIDALTPPPVQSVTTQVANSSMQTTAMPQGTSTSVAASSNTQMPTAPNLQNANQNPQNLMTKKRSKLPVSVLVVLGVVFLAIWGVFWAIIFGFIKI